MEGEGKKEKKKCFTIKKSKTGRKYILLQKRRIYLTTLKKKANAKRLKKGRKLLKRITNQNIENVLMNVLEDIKPKKEIKDDDFLNKIEKEAKKSIKKIKKDVKKDNVKDVVKEAGIDLIEKLKDINNKFRKKDEEDKKKVEEEMIKLYEKNEVPVGTKITSKQFSQEDFKKAQDLTEQQKELEEKVMEKNLLERKIQRRLGQDDEYWDRLIKEKEQFGGMLLNKEQALDNTEIERIMNKYKEFKGVYPLDMVYKSFSLIEPKTEGGLILNLDKSGEPGVHWTALYWNGGGKKPQIAYYDSFGRPPKKETLDDIKNIVKKLNSDKHMKLKVNNVVNQDSSSVSCGYLCIKFLMDMMRNGNFKSATNYGIKESEEDAEQLYEKFKYML